MVSRFSLAGLFAVIAFVAFVGSSHVQGQAHSQVPRTPWGE